MNGREADYPCGPWTGFYQQSGRRFRQDLRLEFARGVVRGDGADPVGRFTVRGAYDPATAEVVWTKSYAKGHRVFYRGFREGKGIWGTWSIPPFDRSGFHIWPVAAAEQEQEAAHEAAPRSVGP